VSSPDTLTCMARSTLVEDAKRLARECEKRRLELANVTTGIVLGTLKPQDFADALRESEEQGHE
jgi:hypothetical protein